jgi:non-heme chloroperoxidase
MKAPLLLACALLALSATGAAEPPSATPPAAPPADARAVPGGLTFHLVRSADGLPLNVVEAGNPAGPPLLFLHGFSQSYLSWLGQLGDSQLRRRFRLVALDLRGHGASGKPWEPSAYAGHEPWARDVRSVVEALGLERPWLVGWSFGGFVALDYVREFGEAAVAGVVLTGSQAGLVSFPTGSAPVDGDLEAAIRNAREFMQLMAASPLPADAVERGVFSHVMLPSYARAAMAGKRLDNTDLRARLTLPMLVILGEEDPSVPVETVRPALSGRANIDVRVYPAVGHSAFLEARERFNADLAAFVAGQPAAANATAIPPVVLQYLEAVNAGDVEAAVSAFAADGEMRLLQGRVAQGHAAIGEIERFHAIARPHMQPDGLRARIVDDAVVVAFDRNVETSRVFDAMGLRRVTTRGLEEAFVVRDGLIAVAHQPEFEPACVRAMTAALRDASAWLDRTADARSALLLPGGTVRMDETTVALWIDALQDWRAATGWAPAPKDAQRCAGS